MNCLKKKISVIIPCYNAEKYLADALDSIINQKTVDGNIPDYDIEIICVDDCSTDNTVEILKRYENNYPDKFLIVLMDVNCKQGAARNTALTYATGDYITYLDADDMFLPYALDVLYKSIEITNSDFVRGKYEECYSGKMKEYHNSLAYCQYEKKSLFSQIDNVLQKYEMSDIFSRKKFIMNYGWNTGASGKIYKTSFLRENKIFFLENTYMEDIYFFELCVLYAKRVSVVDYVVFLYRRSENQTMLMCNSKKHYLDTAVIQNETTIRALNEGIIRECYYEFQFLHYMQAFYFPIRRMINFPECYSYEDYLVLKDNLFMLFPDFISNPYLFRDNPEEMKIEIELLKSDISEIEFRNLIAQ